MKVKRYNGTHATRRLRCLRISWASTADSVKSASDRCNNHQSRDYQIAGTSLELSYVKNSMRDWTIRSQLHLAEQLVQRADDNRVSVKMFTLHRRNLKVCSNPFRNKGYFARYLPQITGGV